MKTLRPPRAGRFFFPSICLLTCFCFFRTTAVSAEPDSIQAELKANFSAELTWPAASHTEVLPGGIVISEKDLPGEGMVNLRIILPPDPGLCDAEVIVKVGGAKHFDHSPTNRRYFTIIGLPERRPVKVEVTARSRELGEGGKPKRQATIVRTVLSNPATLSVGDCEIRFAAGDFEDQDDAKPQETEIIVVTPDAGADDFAHASSSTDPARQKPASENQVGFASTPKLHAYVRYGGEGGTMDHFRFARGEGQTSALWPEIELVHRFAYPRARLPNRASANLFLVLRWSSAADESLLREHRIAKPFPVTFTYRTNAPETGDVDIDKQKTDRGIEFGENAAARKLVEETLSKGVISLRDKPGVLELGGYVQFANGPAIEIAQPIEIELEKVEGE